MDAIDRITIRLKKLLEYVSFLKRFQGVDAQELMQDHIKRGAIERYLQLSAEVVLDVANLLNAEYRFRPAEDGKESILILGEEGILEEAFAKEFSGISGLRNILVHDYLKVDYQKVADMVNHRLGDFETFAKAVSAYLQ